MIRRAGNDGYMQCILVFLFFFVIYLIGKFVADGQKQTTHTKKNSRDRYNDAADIDVSCIAKIFH